MTKWGMSAVGLAASALLTAGCSGGQEGAGAEASAAYTASSTGAIAASRQLASDAYAFCIDKITERLKAPATAQFSDRDPAREGQDGGLYLFTGTVDSENGFGALIRSDWACKIRWTGGQFVAESATIS